MKAIGILGGMGPAASAQTYAQVVGVCQRSFGAREDADFPTIIVYSLPLRGFDAQGFATRSAGLVRQQLIEALHKLEGAGAELLLVDCNTVHVFYAQMQDAVRVPIISLIDTTVAHVVARGCARVGVLASATSRRLRLYDDALERAGVSVVGVSDDEQMRVDEAIFAVMGGLHNRTHIDQLQAIVDRLERDGAEATIAGCTEVSLLLHDAIDGVRYIDSQHLAIHSIVSMSYQL